MVSFLRDIDLTWQQSKRISEGIWDSGPLLLGIYGGPTFRFQSLNLLSSIVWSEVEESGLRISGASRDWSPDSLQDLDSTHEPDFDMWPSWMSVRNHGIVKSCLLTLGCLHHEVEYRDFI